MLNIHSSLPATACLGPLKTSIFEFSAGDVHLSSVSARKLRLVTEHACFEVSKDGLSEVRRDRRPRLVELIRL